MLQRNSTSSTSYSVAVYGEAGLVPSHPRIVWLNLLPSDARAIVARVGLCTLQTESPFRPLFTIPDAIGDGNTLDAAWIHHDNEDGTPFAARPLPSHSWVEVSHCPQKIVPSFVDAATCDMLARRRPLSNRQKYNCIMAREPRRWQWRAGNLWLFAAAGSGVSVNIGRSRAFETYGQAQDFMMRRVVQVNRSWTTGCGAAMLKRNPSGAGASVELDSVQIVGRKESYSRELRHEIIMLRHSECEALTAAMPFVRCGRFPYLRRCSHGEKALKRIAHCGNAAEVRRRHGGRFVRC